MLLLITGSFWWYGVKTDEIVYDQNRFVGKALVELGDAWKPTTTQAVERDAARSTPSRTTRWPICIRSRGYQLGGVLSRQRQGAKKPRGRVRMGLDQQVGGDGPAA